MRRTFPLSDVVMIVRFVWFHECLREGNIRRRGNDFFDTRPPDKAFNQWFIQDSVFLSF
jgi:hypothetical protein